MFHVPRGKCEVLLMLTKWGNDYYYYIIYLLFIIIIYYFNVNQMRQRLLLFKLHLLTYKEWE